MPKGLIIDDVTPGNGAEAGKGSTVTIRWHGTLNRGDSFGGGECTFRIGARTLIAGLEYGVVGMRVGGVRRLRVSPHLGYRDRGAPGVPAHAVLHFEIELLAVDEQVIH